MNKIWILGRLTGDPILAYTESTQTAICKFTLAVDRNKAGNNGQKETDFFRIVTFGKAAETHARYLSKGRQVSITGTVQTGQYRNKDGITVYTTDVLAEFIEYLGSPKNHGERNQRSVEENKDVAAEFETYSADEAMPYFEDVDEMDIPF